MNRFFYIVVMLNALGSVAAAAAVFWRNRQQAEGPLFGATMLAFGAWLVGFGHYFAPLVEATAMSWAKFTVAMAILVSPLWYHTLCAMTGTMRRWRWWIGVAYLTAAVFIGLLWQDFLLEGWKPRQPHMDHYVRYNPSLYVLLSIQLVFWPWFGFLVSLGQVLKLGGYKRTQLIYFLSAWFVIFLTTYSIIIPLHYEINIPPFGFCLLPLNVGFLAYVMSKARLADYNVVIARVLIHTITLIIVVALGLLFVGGAALIVPGFLKASQMVFMVCVLMVVGLTLAVSLPQFMPQAERIMQERLFGSRYGYQDVLGGMIKTLRQMPSIDQLMKEVVSSIETQMQVSCVLILRQDPLTGRYVVAAQSGTCKVQAGSLELEEESPLVKWLAEKQDSLVLDELPKRASIGEAMRLQSELERLQCVVAVPMMLEDRLDGLLCCGPKADHGMFFVRDLRLLSSIASEVALAVKYRRLEEEIFRKNRLVELGTIAAGVAHEIRNPLASIHTFAQLLPERGDDPEFKQEFSVLVQKDVERITRVIESMLAFARPSQVNISDYSAVELVNEAAELVQSRIKARQIELTKHFHEQPTLKVDRHQVLQVLLNLLNNATDAVPVGGKIRVSVGVSEDENLPETSNHRRMAVIEVADNGSGIPAGVRNRLFDPFFTTKKDGTGLGLSISQKIIRDHGGMITVNSVEGHGATFYVYVPMA
jgi:signal transduction histidine kinase